MENNNIKKTLVELVNLLDETFDTFNTCDDCPFTKECEIICSNTNMSLCGIVSMYNNFELK